MTLMWTIVPTEFIFSQDAQKEFLIRQMQSKEATFVLSDAGGGMGKIERLISTNPYDYLRSDWQPGNLVRLVDFDSISG